MSITKTVREMLSTRLGTARRRYRDLLSRADEAKPADAKALVETLETLDLSPADFDADAMAIARSAQLRSSLPTDEQATESERAYQQRESDRKAESATCREHRRDAMDYFRRMLLRESVLAQEQENDRANHAADLEQWNAIRAELQNTISNHPRAFTDADVRELELVTA